MRNLEGVFSCPTTSHFDTGIPGFDHEGLGRDVRSYDKRVPGRTIAGDGDIVPASDVAPHKWAAHSIALVEIPSSRRRVTEIALFGIPGSTVSGNLGAGWGDVEREVSFLDTDNAAT
jgi:hypothetical protein